MKNKYSTYLSQPAPVADRPWLSVLLCVASVVFILALFEPFSFRLNSLGQMWVLIGFACLTLFIASLGFVLFPMVFKRFYHPDKWTIGRSLLNNVVFLLMMGVGVVCYDFFLVMKQSPAYFPMGFFVDLFAVLTIGIAPLSIITIVNQNRTLKRNRTTIRQIEETLQQELAFVRCHRAYIVNTGRIDRVTGNAQGYKLSLRDTSEEIPVSRIYLNAIKEILR
jgi:multisubunit Na+/H+ antiporter MnhG subunit